MTAACKTCMHYRPRSPIVGICKAIRPFNPNTKYPDDAAYLNPQEQNNAFPVLFTAPGFSCVQHEVKA